MNGNGERLFVEECVTDQIHWKRNDYATIQQQRNFIIRNKLSRAQRILFRTQTIASFRITTLIKLYDVFQYLRKKQRVEKSYYYFSFFFYLINYIYTYMHSFGVLQCPCCSLQPGKQRAENNKKQKKISMEKGRREKRNNIVWNIERLIYYNFFLFPSLEDSSRGCIFFFGIVMFICVGISKLCIFFMYILASSFRQSHSKCSELSRFSPWRHNTISSWTN